VSAANYAGGLAGYNCGGSNGEAARISNSYATGNVSGGRFVGGLAGNNYGGAYGGTASIDISYATGGVSGVSEVRRLVGANYGTVSNQLRDGQCERWQLCRRTGGDNGFATTSNSYGTTGNSFWNATTSGAVAGIGGAGAAQTGVTGLTSAQMLAQANWIGFDFTHTWMMYGA